MKIGVMFGNPETTPGGRALKFYSSVRLDIRRISTLKEADQAIGNRVKAKVVKNKMAAPFREAEFDILFDSGVSREGDLIDLAIAQNIVDKSGAWFSFGQVRLGQGREAARAFLRDNPDLVREIEAGIIARERARAEQKEARAASASAKPASPTTDQPALRAAQPVQPVAAPAKATRKQPPPPAKRKRA